MSAHSASKIERRVAPQHGLKGRSRSKNYPWTDERVQFAVGRVKAGVSAANVAKEMERTWPDDGQPTRAAVIGKVNRATTDRSHRNRFVVISNEPRPIAQRIQKINRATASELNRTPPTAVNLEALPVSDIQSLDDPSKVAARKLGPLADQTGKPYSTTSIKHGLCHYPIGDPYKPGFGYCGRLAHVKQCVRVGDDGVTRYCADHRLLMYDPKEDKRRDTELKKLNRYLPNSLRS